MANWRSSTKITVLLLLLAFCFFENFLQRQIPLFQEFEITILQMQMMILICLAVWYGFLLFLTFSLNDLLFIGLQVISISVYLIGYATTWRKPDAISLLAGAMLGRGTQFCLESRKPHVEIGKFLTGLVILLAFSSCLHLDISGKFYTGPRWTGLFENPNIFGMLMSAGFVLAVGLLVGNRKSISILVIAAGVTGMGLLFSYSRGSWLGTAIGLLYLAKAHKKLKWKYILPGFFVIMAVVCLFWNTTSDSSRWYVKRLDFSRASAQHRVAAWKAGFEIMRDHPFGIGWNKTVEVYEKSYMPPEDSAAAITTNDYLMLGTQLGLPGLLCFVAYIWLSFRRKIDRLENHPALVCRAGSLAMLVAFWFDGGLFTLATASVFWILLELGSNPVHRTKTTTTVADTA
jgi:O-antigen ligase